MVQANAVTKSYRRLIQLGVDIPSIKSLKPTDHLEIEIPHFRNPDFKPWLAMVLSIVAVVTAFVAVMKASDDTQLRAAYAAQSETVKELSAEVQDLSQDVATLKGYSEGQAKALTVAVPVKPGASAVPAGSFSVSIPLRVVPFKDVKPDEWNSPVPSLKPPPKPVSLPSFEELKGEKTATPKK